MQEMIARLYVALIGAQMCPVVGAAFEEKDIEKQTMTLKDWKNKVTRKG